MGDEKNFQMESLPYYVPPAPSVKTPTNEEIAKAGILSHRRKPVVFEVLAAPRRSESKRSRWSLPAGKLTFSSKGLVFVTSGKRIGVVEQYLGGKLFWFFKNVGTKFAEPIVGGIVGEQFVKTLVGTYEWNERLESFSEFSEALEHRETFFLPIDRIVSMFVSFEPENQYGIRQLDVAVARNDESFESFEILAREEDGNLDFMAAIVLTYYLRLNYEQRFFQESLFRTYANPSLEIPQAADAWSLASLSFEPEFYVQADASLAAGSPPVDAIRLEALAKSHSVLRRLLDYGVPDYDVETPSGKLYALARAFVAP